MPSAHQQRQQQQQSGTPGGNRGTVVTSRRSATGWPRRTAVLALAAAASIAALAGCETKSFIDPGELGRYRKTPLLLPILNKLDTGVEEPDDTFANATDATPADLTAQGTDYVIGRNDLIQVSVTDLVGAGVETVKTVRVTESGYISLPIVGQIPAAGLTEAQLERAIVEAYFRANIIQNAQVSVSVVEARARTFSIFFGTGAGGQPGQYTIPQADFRVLDALIMARAPLGTATSGQWVYIVRRPQTLTNPATPPSPTTSNPDGAGPAAPATAPAGPDILAPRSRVDFLAPIDHPVYLQTSGTGGATEVPTGRSTGTAPTPRAGATTAPANENEGGRYVIIDGKPVFVPGPAAAAPVPAPANPPPATVTPVTPAAAPTETTAIATPPVPTTQPSSQPFEFNDDQAVLGERTIRLPLTQLLKGDFRYNIVIRPNDLIYMPGPTVGFYYLGGHIARVGVYNISQEGITLKQAVIGAGMLDQIAIPQRCDVIRRIGTDKEVYCRIDLDAIFAGKQPDFFIKPNDQIMVGTNAIAPFLAAIRGGFRFSYGLGFAYDRNFSPAQKQSFD